ncbi:hypothetical protein FB45DRAFT_1001591 [Roridomyces roridus]|uniref:Uncharacterized protein n=1 Tax=Roridomyces roridus TaxID=1738132 RepID=A0AAD7FT01_9AGAR|nr:hypothetical protein FB45DRAFT_1001591 [Roridomyces roridus]
MSINISIIVRFHVLNQLNVLPSFLSVKKMFRMTENGEQLCSEVEYLKHQLVSSYTNQLALIKAGSTLAPLKMKAGIHPATIQIPSVSDIGYTSRAQLPLDDPPPPLTWLRSDWSPMIHECSHQAHSPSPLLIARPMRTLFALFVAAARSPVQDTPGLVHANPILK